MTSFAVKLAARSNHYFYYLFDESHFSKICTLNTWYYSCTELSMVNYVPLIWMFANKSLIDKILKIHKRTLQTVYDVYDESYENLLNKSDDISVHLKHLLYLAIEVYKSWTIVISNGFLWLCLDQHKSWFHV